MKAKVEHRVPLTPRCVEILDRARDIAGGSATPAAGYIFPGRMAGRPLTNMVFLMTLRRMGVECTPHGFRSSFRDWASETTNFPHDVVEMALAHTIRDKTEAAYRRGDLFDKRRELMAAWTAYATAKKGDVIALRGKESNTAPAGRR